MTATLAMIYEVPQTIYTQLGGKRFSAMTGATDFIVSKSKLRFKLGRFAEVKCTHVEIELMNDDTYTIKFQRVWGRTVRTLAEETGIYCDNLRQCFTRNTGLDTNL